MYEAHLRLLVYPRCRSELRLGEVTCRDADAISEGALECAGCGADFPIVAGVPRFVPRENYATGFGFEWMQHARMQSDSYSGIAVSKGRFFKQTRWPRRLENELRFEVSGLEPQRIATMKRWGDEAGLVGTESEYTPHGITVRGRLSPAIGAFRR